MHLNTINTFQMRFYTGKYGNQHLRKMERINNVLFIITKVNVSEIRS